MATIRFFAAAADVVGASTLERPVSTVGELRTSLETEFGLSAAKVIAQCSLLVNGRRVSDDTHPLALADTVDVLPPFAGG